MGRRSEEGREGGERVREGERKGVRGVWMDGEREGGGERRRDNRLACGC